MSLLGGSTLDEGGLYHMLRLVGGGGYIQYYGFWEFSLLGSDWFEKIVVQLIIKLIVSHFI